MLSGRLKELCLEGGLFSDVMFQLEDGTAAVHRPLLMARCDMMHAMFSGDFRESNAKVVSWGLAWKVVLHIVFSTAIVMFYK